MVSPSQAPFSLRQCEHLQGKDLGTLASAQADPAAARNDGFRWFSGLFMLLPRFAPRQAGNEIPKRLFTAARSGLQANKVEPSHIKGRVVTHRSFLLAWET